jgi:hypothetical protein
MLAPPAPARRANEKDIAFASGGLRRWRPQSEGSGISFVRARARNNAMTSIAGESNA